MDIITQYLLNAQLELHQLWLDSNQKNGKSFSVADVDFSGLDFNLWYKEIRPDLKKTSLVGANLKKCNFTNCLMQNVDLESINVSNSDFSGANLSGANLKSCDFTGVLIDEYTDFSETCTEDMIVDEKIFYHLPEFIKKSKLQRKNDTILTTTWVNKTDAFLKDKVYDLLSDTIQIIYPEIKVSHIQSNDGATYIFEAIDKKTNQLLDHLIESFVQLLTNDNLMNTRSTDFAIIHLKNELRFLEARYESFKDIYELAKEKLNDVRSENKTLKESLEQIRLEISEQRQNLKIGDGKVKVKLKSGEFLDIYPENVVYIEQIPQKMGSGILLYLEDKVEPLELSGVIGNLNKLCPNTVRCSENFVVNLSHYIKNSLIKKTDLPNNNISYKNYSIELKHCDLIKKIPISNRSLGDVNAILENIKN